MKKIVMATAMAMLFAGGAAFAEGSTSKEKSGSASGSSTEEYGQGGSGSMSGSAQSEAAAKKGILTVKDVDQANNKVTFEAQVAPTTKILSATGEKLSLAQIKEGDEVRANFDPKTGNLQKMTVQSPKKGAQGGSGSSGSESKSQEKDLGQDSKP